MGKVVIYASVSVDGFIADENDQPGPLFDWLTSGDMPLDDSGFLYVSQASFDLFELGTGLPRSCPGRAVSLLHAAEAVEERDESGRGESASDEGPRQSGIGRCFVRR